jgi:hypothetical protein
MVNHGLTGNGLEKKLILRSLMMRVRFNGTLQSSQQLLTSVLPCVDIIRATEFPRLRDFHDAVALCAYVVCCSASTYDRN